MVATFGAFNNTAISSSRFCSRVNVRHDSHLLFLHLFILQAYLYFWRVPAASVKLATDTSGKLPG